MSSVLTLPRLGETMETGRVVGWLKQPGERFRRGETLVEIESDKTVVELPALADGRLLEVLAPPGTSLDVGAPLCRYERPDEPVTEAAPAAADPAPVAVASAAAPVAPAPAAIAPLPEGARSRATPLARRLARANGIDLAAVRGTGRRGRVEARDVRAADPGNAEDLAVTRWPATGAQRGTALLLHGFGGDAQVWAGLAAHLTRRGFAVAAPDLPGHGATTIEATEIAQLAGPLAPLLESGAPVELVGHSLGAVVAVALARRHPDRIARLTLLAPAGLGAAIDAEFVHGLAAVRTSGGLAHLLRRLSPRLAASPEQLATMARGLAAGRLAVLAEALAGGGRQQVDIVPDLVACAAPVRAVWGLADAIIPWTQVTALPTRVAIHLIPGAGHMPHWDAPQAVAELFD